MATVRRSVPAAKASRAGRKPSLSLASAPAPPPQCTRAMLLPHGREKSARIVRALLVNYLAFREVYHDWLRVEDARGNCDERRAELDRLTPEGRAGAWPAHAWRHVLADTADYMVRLLVQAVVVASGQLGEFDDILDVGDGSGSPWEPCAVEVDGRLIAVAPFVYEGEDSGGAVDHRFANASLVITEMGNVVALGSPGPAAS